MSGTGDEVVGFTVCCLLYGNYPELARRCVGSLCSRLDADLVSSIRIGLNQVSDSSRLFVRDALRERAGKVRQVLVYDCGKFNRLKYPLLRKMIHDHQMPVVTPYLMHFDDDSCLAPGTTSAWWRRVYDRMQNTDMIGSIYRYPIKGQQAEGIRQQSWYTGRQITPGHHFVFATGGWWCIRTVILQRWDYPFTDISHNGGDTVLGELIRQQQLRLASFKEGVWINADVGGRSSKAARRGEHRRPVWYDSAPVSNGLHDFVIEPYDPR